MKNNYLAVNLAVLLAIGVLFAGPVTKDHSRKYNSRKSLNVSASASGAIEYLNQIRANQETKTIDVADVFKAQEQLKAKNALKNSKATTWIYRGPDNIGGRTRAILIDKDQSNVMYAGGVSGGLWKTTTSGQYWLPVQYGGSSSVDFANLAVVSICQAANGDIYFGTGEGFFYNHGGNTSTPMMLGAGIWKSSNNGDTFERLASTWPESDHVTFSLVNEMAADPTQNIIYAATVQGLKYTTDGGLSWSNAPLDNSSYNNSVALDVNTASDGSVIAAIGNRCFVKKSGTSTFVMRSGETENLIQTEGVTRIEFAYSPTDANYVYAVAANDVGLGELNNIYKSVDGGLNWVIVGKGGSALFQPFGSQGVYDMLIAVNPVNKEQVFIGGLNIYSGIKVQTGDLFAWSQISLNSLSPYHPLYVHSDQHTMVFDPKNPKTCFIGSDGGISRCLFDKDGYDYQFTRMNKNYNVTQFYSVASNNLGMVMGGTQDNSVILVKEQPEVSQNGDVMPFEIANSRIYADGGHVAMSKMNPVITFGTAQFGGLWRNNLDSYDEWRTFYSSKIVDAAEWTGTSNWEMDKEQSSFVTPIALWETANDIFSFDSVQFIARKDYENGQYVNFDSRNIYKMPVKVKLERDYAEGDTIYYHDPYSSLFALGMKREIWLTRNAENFIDEINSRTWWQVLAYNTLSSDEYITQLAFSANGNHLFFSTSEQDIYRLSNLNNARTFYDASYDDLAGSNQVTVLTKIGNANGRFVTGITCDPKNENNIMITLGNYGNDDYIYLCTQASYVNQSEDLNNFINVTGDMPKVPAYCALFEMKEEGKTAMIGTEMGVFMTDNLFSQVSATNVQWEPYQDAVGPVPVFQITQNTAPYKTSGGNYGKIYIATHGRGIFEDRTYVGIGDDFAEKAKQNKDELPIEIYPNPLVDDAILELTSTVNGELSIEIVNLSGQVVKIMNEGYKFSGDHKLNIKLGELTTGVYIMNVRIGEIKGSKRIIKK
ncbi:MAG: T9SS type A sorting domain-containing protein [Salinivirgaceae bacterium]|nr:T9SS type A sorting domain-containing protein [Salinivirgaceae bacterium]